MEATPGLPERTGRHHGAPPSPQMGFICSHLWFSLKNELFSTGFLACLVKSVSLANRACIVTWPQSGLQGESPIRPHGGSPVCHVPPLQSTSLMDVPPWLSWAHRVPLPVQISPVSLCPSLPGRQAHRQTHASPKDYFLFPRVSSLNHELQVLFVSACFGISMGAIVY